MSRIEIKHCVMCGKEFKIFFGASRTRKMGLRQVGSRTCSKSCSKEYRDDGNRIRSRIYQQKKREAQNI